MPKQIDGERILVFYSNTNTHGKHDATGAFIPEARAFCTLHNVPVENQLGVKCPGISKAVRRRRVLDFISEHGHGVEAIAFFGHGWPKGIQFGFDRKHIPELTNVIRQRCAGELYVSIYACLAAENDQRDNQRDNIGPATNGGFADLFRDSLEKNGIKEGWVDAHKTAGHTSWNPYVVRFLIDSSLSIDESGIGGSWLVGPRSQFWKKWRRSLKATDLRHRFPFMTELEIKTELHLNS